MKLTDFRQKKQAGQKVVMLTAYDYPTARWQAEAGVDVLLVGDSVGRNILGYESEVEVTMADMLHHTRAVARGAGDAYVLGDMPFRSFDTSDIALSNARRFLQAGAHGVKMEGEAVLDQVAAVAGDGISVCAHIGYTPQTDGLKASVQGKDLERARELITIARQLEAAGADMIVLELVPAMLAAEISGVLQIPTIGIGAGPHCDGQVQVYCDILGLSERVFRHAKAYDDLRQRYQRVFEDYVKEVRNGEFPTLANAAELPPDVAEEIRAWLAQS